MGKNKIALKCISDKLKCFKARFYSINFLCFSNRPLLISARLEMLLIGVQASPSYPQPCVGVLQSCIL